MGPRPFCTIIAGAGSGIGRATAIKFAKTYSVVLLARKPESYRDMVAEIEQAGGHALGITADMADINAVNSAFDVIQTELPNSKLAAAVYNVNSGFSMKPFLDLKKEDLDASLGAVQAFFMFAQKALPLLLESTPHSPYPPSLVITGATASIKGSANFASFSAGKFALRAMGQSLAREFGPRGVHVAHVILDGGVDTPRAKQFVMNDGVEDGKVRPEAVAESYWHLHTQHRSAFTQEIDIRPYVEKF